MQQLPFGVPITFHALKANLHISVISPCTHDTVKEAAILTLKQAGQMLPRVFYNLTVPPSAAKLISRDPGLKRNPPKKERGVKSLKEFNFD